MTNRKRIRRFRPTLDGTLETRELLSGATAAAQVRSGVPRFPSSSFATVQAAVDEAFDDYRGKATVGRAFGSALAWILSDKSDTTPTNDPSAKGDRPRLVSGVLEATSRLPYARSGFVRRIDGLLNSNLAHGSTQALQRRIKVEIHRYVTQSVRQGLFVVVP